MKKLAVIPTIFAACLANAETGVTEGEIVVGSTMSLTGTLAKRAGPMHEGAQLYFERLNASGGVNGRKVKLVTYDDAYEPKRTSENVEKLIQTDKVFAIFHVLGTPGSKAIMPMIDAQNIPFFAPLTGADFLREPVNKNVFAVRARFKNEADRIVKFLLEEKKAKKIAILYQDDAFGTGGRGAVEKILFEKGLKFVGAVKYQRNSQTIDNEYKEIEALKPDGVILWSVSKTTASFVKLAAKSKMPAVLVAMSSSDEEGFADNIKDAKADFYITHSMPFEIVQQTDFFKQYEKDINQSGKLKINLETFEGYTNAAIFSEGLRRAGSSPTREGLRKAFEGMKDYDLKGLKVEFAANNHQALSKVVLLRVENGKYFPVSSIE